MPISRPIDAVVAFRPNEIQQFVLIKTGCVNAAGFFMRPADPPND
jgi:hypothetical protein